MTMFIHNLPTYWAALVDVAKPWIDQAYALIPLNAAEELSARLKDYISEYTGTALKFTGAILKNIFMGSMAFLHILSLLFIMPIVAFYIIRDWHEMIKIITRQIPKKYLPKVKDLFSQIDATLAGFIRGQLLVCLILGAFYGIALSIAGPRTWSVNWFDGRLISFIPYVGSVTGFAAAMGVALNPL